MASDGCHCVPQLAGAVHGARGRWCIQVLVRCRARGGVGGGDRKRKQRQTSAFHAIPTVVTEYATYNPTEPSPAEVMQHYKHVVQQNRLDDHSGSSRETGSGSRSGGDRTIRQQRQTTNVRRHVMDVIMRAQGCCDLCHTIYIPPAPVLGDKRKLADVAAAYRLQWTLSPAVDETYVSNLPASWTHCGDCKNFWTCSPECAGRHRAESCMAYGNHIMQYEESHTYSGKYPNIAVMLPSIWLSQSTMKCLNDID